MSSKKKEEEYVCPYDLNLTAEEEDAINWLQHHLEEVATSCGPASRMAHIAHAAVGKVFAKGEELHSIVHARNVSLLEAEMLVAGMAGLPQSMGLVKDEDLN